MNTFAVFVEDSDPVERIEDAPTNEARQEADQVVTIEEAEYLITEIDAQGAESPVSDTFTFELSDDDEEDEEEEHQQDQDQESSLQN